MTSIPNPLISVVMPVYNALPFLDESISSILNQTLTDFEFVIFDDASTDGSVELLRQWSLRDKRIHLHESKKQLDVSGSSDAVVLKACAPIVARMDADDIAHQDRLRRQWEILQGRPDVAVVGTLCNGIDAGGREFVLATAGGWSDAPFTFHSPMALPCFVARFLTRSVPTLKGGRRRRPGSVLKNGSLRTRRNAPGRSLQLPLSLK